MDFKQWWIIPKWPYGTYFQEADLQFLQHSSFGKAMATLTYINLQLVAAIGLASDWHWPFELHNWYHMGLSGWFVVNVL